jgi:ABC-type uncharacterized transport system substrate-binding protein
LAEKGYLQTHAVQQNRVPSERLSRYASLISGGSRMRRREFLAGLCGAAAWPHLADAQQPTMPVIGLLQSRSVEAAVQVNEAFREGLREAGFVEGRNVAIAYRFAGGRFDLLPALAADLVSQQVAVIAAVYPASRAAKAATSTIPIVFIGGSDPVEMGLVASINRPGGNVTGVSLLATDLENKRIGLLREVAPQTAKIGALIDRTDPSVYPESEKAHRELRAAAGRLSVPIEIVPVAGAYDFDAAFDALCALGSAASSLRPLFFSISIVIDWLNSLRVIASQPSTNCVSSPTLAD